VFREPFLQRDRLQQAAKAGMPPAAIERMNAQHLALQLLNIQMDTERVVAHALERANVAFFPNARGRLGTAPDFRESREPDFLVVDDGRLGVLEVDGDEWHPAENAAAEHVRDRLFRRHGIRVVERFPASECYEDPDRVVAEFT
jgi:hypothetical protein